MAYSKEEIEAFNAKELRISRVAILKSLIESGRNNANEAQENCELANQYVEFVYNGMCEKGEVESSALDWKAIAKELSLAEPNGTNIKVLDTLWDRYKSIYKVSANPAILLAFVWDSYSKYPTNKNSIETILKKLGEQKNE